MLPEAAGPRIALGTAQFGMDYGISNREGRVPTAEVARILAAAKAAGLLTLDTAMSYGSEAVLGQAGVDDWRVISKLPPCPPDAPLVGWVTRRVDESCKRLGVKSLYGLLLHNPLDLVEKRGSELRMALNEQRERGRVSKIGVSIYNPEELDALSCVMQLEIVQAPYNVLDQRICSSGWSARLRSEGCEIHARSVFLQGLLLMSEADRPAYFGRWRGLWEAWRTYLAQASLAPLEACLRFVYAAREIDQIVVGVTSAQQLGEVLFALGGPLLSLPAGLACDDPELLNPALWRLQ